MVKLEVLRIEEADKLAVKAHVYQLLDPMGLSADRALSFIVGDLADQDV
jgi:hypothetical protein